MNQKKYNQVVNHNTSSTLKNQEIKTAQIIEQNMEFEKFRENI